VVAARETTLQELLEGTKQYQVPLYQRTYSWKRAQLERLWRDILQLAEDRATNPDLTHFIGSLVLAPSPANGPAGVMEFLVVDGQQRLTTLTLLDHRRSKQSDLTGDTDLTSESDIAGDDLPVVESSRDTRDDRRRRGPGTQATDHGRQGRHFPRTGERTGK
jgi:uncharacterized protein with ParB-like and HNH nuclease domain